VSAIEVRLPILEAEKKMAASKRDFKAAGKASKEIKDALARKDQCEAELADEALVRKEDAKEALSKAVALLDEKKSIAAEKGMELGLKQMAALRDKIRVLRSILKDFDASTDPDSLSVASVGAFVIESQIGILEARGIALGEKYGGWNDSPKSNEVVEDDTVQSAPTFDSTDDATDKEVTSEILEQYIVFKAEASTIEAAIDKAAEEEDYEKAAELEEKLELVCTGIEALGISKATLEEALANGIADVDHPETHQVAYHEENDVTYDTDAEIECSEEDEGDTKVV
jgi:hypothetical protein